MFVRVNSKCAHQVRPPLRAIQVAWRSTRHLRGASTLYFADALAIHVDDDCVSGGRSDLDGVARRCFTA
jgi:hypothetical protein